MKQTDQEIVTYILKEIGNMEKIISGRTKEDLETDFIFERAVSMTLQIIGEKINKISDEFQLNNPGIAWRKIKGLRNRISHEYENLDFDVIYTAATESMNYLRDQLLTADFSQNINIKLPSHSDEPKGLKL
ncbi:MAG: DUF86 domain-containing protein [Bacteroidota bacterium]